MYETQADAEWTYILKDSGAKVCFVANRSIYDRVQALRGKCPDLLRVVAFENAPEGEPSFSTILEPATPPGVPFRPADPEDPASIIYTSGTTGNPKGVTLTHGNLATNVGAILDITPLSPGERSLGFLPWAHVYGGCLEIHTGIATGGSVAICDNATKLADYIREVQPTVLFAVPRVWNRIYDGISKQMASKPKSIRAVFHGGMRARSKEKRGEKLKLGDRIALAIARKLVFSRVKEQLGGKLRFAFSGAASLSADVAEFIDNLGIDVYEGYGMTECGGVVASNKPDERRIGSVGKPVPGVEVKLDHTVAGADPGEGEIIVYGPGVMAGYHRLPEVTEGTLTPDGGLRTGDLGRFDKDGFLYITGRAKELFKLSNGKYVAPAALEEKLQLSPYVSQCLVYGDDQPHPVALVVVDPGALGDWAREHGIGPKLHEILNDPRTRELYERELEKYGAGFKGYERVRAFVLESEPLTTENGMLTPTLKVKRRNVVRKYEERFRALYADAALQRAESLSG